MIDLQIESTKTSPFVLLDSENGVIRIQGKSTPESSINFYFPLIGKIKSLFKRNRVITVDIALEYFNTSSSKCIFDLFRVLQKLERKGAELRINWYYEEDDEDMLESGEDYEDILGLTFNYVVLEVDDFQDPMALVA